MTYNLKISVSCMLEISFLVVIVYMETELLIWDLEDTIQIIQALVIAAKLKTLWFRKQMLNYKGICGPQYSICTKNWEILKKGFTLNSLN